MDFLGLAFNYLISLFIGVSLETLSSRFYTADKIAEKTHHSESNALYYDVGLYDFIIVGGGTAGCVVANRLSAHNYRVLLLEAGGNPFPLTSVPSMALKILQLHDPNIDWGYKTVPQKHAFKANTNNSYRINRGKGLGGSSLLNLNVYMRGSPYDFDEWANITGDNSWTYSNLLPFFKRMENYEGAFPNHYFHGRNGPLHIEKPPFIPMREEWLAAGKEIGLEVKDPNGFQSQSVFPYDYTIKQGTHFSTHRAYLYPALGRPNLRVITYAHVEKIIFDGKNNAVAVSYLHNNKSCKAVATREIVLSAGAVASPQILMLSGVGPKEQLNLLGISVKVDLPVGKNFLDHYETLLGPFNVDKGEAIMDGRDFDSAALYNYLHSGSGPYGLTGFTGGAIMTSSLATNRHWPDIYAVHWPTGIHTTFASEMEKVFDLTPGILQQYLAQDVGNDSFFVTVVVAKPKSVGELKLASSDPRDYPIIDPNHLSHPDDGKVLVEGMKRIFDMVTKSKAFEKIGTKFTESRFPGCEHFPIRSDEYWDCYGRRFGISQWHVSGTCRMGKASGDPSAVVDSRLRVLGTTGLRVIDASIMPQVTTTNINSPTIMIAEKGSQMILDDWGSNIWHLPFWTDVVRTC